MQFCKVDVQTGEVQSYFEKWLDVCKNKILRTNVFRKKNGGLEKN